MEREKAYMKRETHGSSSDDSCMSTLSFSDSLDFSGDVLAGCKIDPMVGTQ